MNRDKITGNCWICGGMDMELKKTGNLPDKIDGASFRITDAGYGRTADIFQCSSCGFLQCSKFTDVLQFYREMDDEGYEATRDQRALQSRRLLKTLGAYKPAGRLLDVGAGSGILVGEALQMGYVAEGVEPSVTLQARAAELSLPVKLGVLEDTEFTTPFDSVCLIDVIEHVPDPVDLLRQIRPAMADDGVLMIVTPDVRSVAARVLGWKWWHYRIAHIGYFNNKTLERAVQRAGFEVVSITRPSWYFTVDYLVERVLSYLPRAVRFSAPGFLGSMTIKLNLFDSICLVCKRAPRQRNIVSSENL